MNLIKKWKTTKANNDLNTRAKYYRCKRTLKKMEGLSNRVIHVQVVDRSFFGDHVGGIELLISLFDVM